MTDDQFEPIGTSNEDRGTDSRVGGLGPDGPHPSDTEVTQPRSSRPHPAAAHQRERELEDFVARVGHAGRSRSTWRRRPHSSSIAREQVATPVSRHETFSTTRRREAGRADLLERARPARTTATRLPEAQRRGGVMGRSSSWRSWPRSRLVATTARPSGRRARRLAYDDLVVVCEAILDDPGFARAHSSAVTTDRGVVVPLRVARVTGAHQGLLVHHRTHDRGGGVPLPVVTLATRWSSSRRRGRDAGAPASPPRRHVRFHRHARGRDRVARASRGANVNA